MQYNTIVAGISSYKVNYIQTGKTQNTLAIVKTGKGNIPHYKGVISAQIKSLSSVYEGGTYIDISLMRRVEGIEAVTATTLNQEHNVLDFDCRALIVENGNAYTAVTLECNSEIVNNQSVPTMSEWSIILMFFLFLVAFKNRLIKGGIKASIKG